jgi:hypothetical protein
MKAHTLLTKAAAGLGTVALALLMGACSHTNATANTDYGNIRTEQTAQQQPVPSDQVVAAAPAPANTQGVSSPETPAVISGPAKVDSSGRLYTSSSVGSAGNASATGLNTDVNIIPKPAKSTVTVTETPTPIVETTPAPVVVETPAPAPAPPVVEETPAPMTSSNTETTTTQTTHRRLRKD